MPNKAEALRFLEELFGDKPEESEILIWSLPSKESRWFSEVDKAATYATEKKLEKAEVYMGCGLSAENLGPNARCKAADIVGIPGLWIDVDVKGPAHKKPNLPPNMKSAMNLINEAPIKPSIIVNSGGGLQAWWLFKELWVFESNKEREKAEKITRGWNQTLKNQAELKGWEVDATWDLARIFRVPGTNNNKSAKTREVKIIGFNKNRYNPSDIEEYISEKSLKIDVSNLATKIAQEIVLKADANPPIDKLEALIENVEGVKEVWYKKKRKIAGEDDSASSYNMSLANYCVLALWSNQEIANAIIAWRRKHGEDLKLRNDLYGRTIARARADIKIDEDIKAAEEKIERISEGEDIKENKIEIVNKLLGSELASLLKYKGDKPSYKLILKDGRSGIFKIEHLMQYRLFKYRYAEISDKRIYKVKPKIWEAIEDVFMNLAKENQVELGPEVFNEGAIVEWIQQYIEQRNPAESLNKSTIERNTPWKDENNIYIRMCDFKTWMERYMGINLKDIPRLLSAVGFNHIRKSVLGGKTTRSYWKKTI